MRAFEMSPACESVRGLAIIQQHFSAGEAGPITVLLESTTDWSSIDNDSKASLILSLIGFHLQQANRVVTVTPNHTGNIPRPASCPPLQTCSPTISSLALRLLIFRIKLIALDHQFESTPSSDRVAHYLASLPLTFLHYHSPPDPVPAKDTINAACNMRNPSVNPATQTPYDQRMAEYHSRLLNQVMTPGECPIGSEAEIQPRPCYAVVLIENVSLAHIYPSFDRLSLSDNTILGCRFPTPSPVKK